MLRTQKQVAYGHVDVTATVAACRSPAPSGPPLYAETTVSDDGNGDTSLNDRRIIKSAS